MSNRTLVTYEEKRLPEGPYWTLEVQRSAAGQPGILFTIRQEAFGDAYIPGGWNKREEMTIFVEDANEIIGPIQNWLDNR